MTQIKDHDDNFTPDRICQEQWIDVIQNASDLIQCVDIEGNFNFVNITWMKTLGYDKKELSSLKIWDIIHPADLEKCKIKFEKVISGEDLGIFISRFKTKSGQIIHLEGSVNCYEVDGKPKWTRGIFRDVSERNNLQIELDERDSRFKMLAENQKDVVISISADGTLEYCSPAIKEFGGYDAEDELGENLIKYIGDENELPQIIDKMAEMVRKRSSNKIEFLYKPKNLDPFYIEVSGKPRIENDEVTGIYGVMRDISDQRYIQKLIEIQRDIYDMSSRGLDLDISLNKITDIIAELDLVDNSSILFKDRDSEDLVLKYGSGLDHEMKKTLKNFVPGSNEYQLIMKGSPTFMDINVLSSLESEVKNNTSSQPMLMIPLLVSREIQGALIVGSNRVSKFSQILMDGLENISFDICSLIERTTERKEKEETERRLNIALEGANLGMWEMDLKTNSIMHGDRFFKLLGYSESDIDDEYEFLRGIIHPEDSSGIMELIGDHIEGRIPVYEKEIRYRTNKGEWRWFLDRGRGFEKDENGIPTKISGTHLDITDRKRTETILKQSEERFRNLFDNSPLGIYQTTPSGAIMMGNPALVRMLGFDSFEEFKSTNLEDIYCNNEGREIFQKIMMERGEVNGIELELKRKDGSSLSVLEFSRAIKDQNGEIVTYEGIMEDITEKKKTEKKLKETYLQLEKAQELAHVGSWVLDLSSNMITCSQETFRILGIDPENEMISLDEIRQLVHPDDRNEYSTWLENWLEMGGFETGEFRFQTMERGIRHIHIGGEMVLDDKEEPTKLTGAIMDLTDLKKAQLEIGESESRLKMILDQIQAGVIIIEVDGNVIQEANPKALEMIGLPREEVIGKKCQKFICPSIVCDCRSTDRDHGFENSEKVLLNKDGIEIPVLKNIARIKLGGKECFLESLVDISEMKKAQDLLRKSEEKIRYSREQYELAVKGSNEGIWDWDIQMNSVYFSQRWKGMIGYAEEELEDLFDTFTDLLHHDDRDRVTTYINNYLKTGTGKFETEFRFKHKDGTYRWILSRGEAIRDEKGNAIRMAGSHSDITVRKEAESRIKKSEEQLKSFVQSATDGIILLDSEMNLVLANDKGFERFFIPKEEALGKHITELVPQIEGTERYVKYIETMKTGKPFFLPELIRNWTPGVPQFTLKAFKVGEGLGLIVSDVTKIKEMEYEYKIQKAYMEDLFEGAPEGIAVLNQDDIVQKVNREFTKMFGFEPSEAEGKNIADMIVPKGKEEESHDLTKSVIDGETVYFESKRKTKWGELKDISILGTPIHLSDGEVKTYAIYRDISEDIKQRRELEDAKEKAEEGARSKSEFLANMSHEIRTPMNAILGFTDILSEQELTDKQRAFLGSISSSGKTLLTLINDILDLSKIDAGKMDINYCNADPHTIFNEMKHVFSKKVDDKGIGFDVEVSELVPRSLIIDEVRLRQILLNLAGNAVKFTDEGGIKLSVTRTNIEEDGSQIDLRFSVKDTGIGIPDDQIDKIFGTFEQMKGQDTGKYGGTGLGLAISKRLVEMMNGKIWVESKVGEGSEFIVEFFNVAVGSIYELEKTTGSHIDYMFKGSTILIVDDIVQNRLLVKGLLVDRGLEFLEAENGKDAIDHLREGGIDLVLMDMKMPVMTGYEATRIIKADKDLSAVPIVALTASAMVGDEQRILDMGCDGYLRKPVDKMSLLKELSKFLAHDEEEIKEEILDIPQDQVCIQEDIEVIREILPELTGDLRSQVMIALDTGSMDDANDLADRMIGFGKENCIESIEVWGNTLKDLVDGFDIEGMIRHMKGYGSTISKLEVHAGIGGE